MPLDPEEEVRILKAYGLTQVCRVVISEQDIFGAQQWINRKRERERLDSLKAVRLSRSKIIREDDQSQSSSSSKDSNHTIHVPLRPSSQPPTPLSTSATQPAGCVSSPESIGSSDTIDEELSIGKINDIKSYRELVASSPTVAYRSPVTNNLRSDTKTNHKGGGDDPFEFRFPHNMKDLHRLEIPHTKMKAVTLERLNAVFIIRAERGAVDWNLYYKNSLQEMERYNLYTKGLLGKAAEYTPYRRMDDWVPELIPKKGKKSRPAEGSYEQYEDNSEPQEVTRIQYYTCKSCNLEFTNYREYECHLVNHIRPQENGFTCSVSNCAFTSSKYTTLVSHCKSTHISFRCTFCKKSFAKLEQTEKHSAQTHKQFGRPFKCSLCEFRSATFGIYMRHREYQHGILTVTSETTTTEKCKLCEEEFIFSSFEIQIQHLAFHAGQFLLYKCRECEFRADSPSKFHDHGMEYHIGFMIDDNNGDLWYPPDLAGLVGELGPIVRKRFGSKGVKASVKKSLPSARDKPTAFETQSAVEALLLDGSEEQELENSHIENEINLSEFEEIMSSIPPLTSSSPTAVDDSLLTSLSSSLEELTPMKPVQVSPSLASSRPKRKSFVDAVAKINKDAREEEEGKQHAADKGISLPLIPDMSLPLNQSNQEQSSQESGVVDYEQGDGSSYSSQQTDNCCNGDNVYLSDVQPALTSTHPVASPLTTQLTAAAAALDAVYDPTHKHLYVNGNPIVDETGTPLQMEEEEIPNLLNTIASSLTVVDDHRQQQMVEQPMDVSYVDPTTEQYVQQLPTSLPTTMEQFTQPSQQFYGVAQQQVPVSLSDGLLHTSYAVTTASTNG